MDKSKVTLVIPDETSPLVFAQYIINLWQRDQQQKGAPGDLAISGVTIEFERTKEDE